MKGLGATEVRGHGGMRQSRDDEWGLNSCTREVDDSSVCRAAVTRMEISIAAIHGNFIGTGEINRKFLGTCLVLWGKFSC